MPAARISSGPSASKRRYLFPPAISSAQSARSAGVSWIGRGVDQRHDSGWPCSRDARVWGRVGGASSAAGPQSTRRSISPRRSSIRLPPPVVVRAEQRPVHDRASLLLCREPIILDDPGNAGPRRRDARRHLGRGRAEPVGVERTAAEPDGETRSAPRRPSEWRRAMWPSSPRSFSRVDQAGQPALDQPIESLRGASVAPRDRERQRRGRRLRPLPAAPGRRQSA